MNEPVVYVFTQRFYQHLQHICFFIDYSLLCQLYYYETTPTEYYLFYYFVIFFELLYVCRYFDDDEDDEQGPTVDGDLEYQPAPDSPGQTKGSGGDSDADSVDPLDAFMEGIDVSSY